MAMNVDIRMVCLLHLAVIVRNLNLVYGAVSLIGLFLPSLFLYLSNSYSSFKLGVNTI